MTFRLSSTRVVQTINVVFCCPEQETGEVLTSDEGMAPSQMQRVHTQGLCQGFSRKGPWLVSPFPVILWNVSPKIFYWKSPTFSEPGQIRYNPTRWRLPPYGSNIRYPSSCVKAGEFWAFKTPIAGKDLPQEKLCLKKKKPSSHARFYTQELMFKI